MDNIIYYRRLQLEIIVIVIFHSGNRRRLPLKFGPFRTRRDLADWTEKFLDEFLKSCLQLPGVESCVRPSEKVDTYDKKEKGIIFPEDPLLVAWEVVNLYFDSEDPENGLEGACGLTNRWYEWVSKIRFDFNQQDSYVVDRTFGPINDISAFRLWWKRFKRGVREIAAEHGHVRFRVLRGEFVDIGEYAEEEIGEDGFYEITFWDPIEKGHECFKEILKEWFKECNYAN